MAYSLDPDIAAPLSALNAAFGDTALPERGDWQECRAMSNAFFAAAGSAKARVGGVTVTRHGTVAPDGAPVELRWYGRGGETPGSAAVYLHRGGMIGGSLDLYEPFIRSYVAASGVPMLGVEYRLASEHSHPVPVEDAYAGLRWLADHAQEKGRRAPAHRRDGRQCRRRHRRRRGPVGKEPRPPPCEPDPDLSDTR